MLDKCRNFKKKVSQQRQIHFGSSAQQIQKQAVRIFKLSKSSFTLLPRTETFCCISDMPFLKSENSVLFDFVQSTVLLLNGRHLKYALETMEHPPESFDMDVKVELAIPSNFTYTNKVQCFHCRSGSNDSASDHLTCTKLDHLYTMRSTFESLKAVKDILHLMRFKIQSAKNFWLNNFSPTKKLLFSCPL